MQRGQNPPAPMCDFDAGCTVVMLKMTSLGSRWAGSVVLESYHAEDGECGIEAFLGKF